MKTVLLGDVCKVVNGGTPDTKNSSFWDGGIFWITPRDMGKLEGVYVSQTTRTISNEGFVSSSAKMIPKNSIILSTRAPIGHLAINTVEMTTNQGCKGIVPSAKIDVNYLHYFLLTSIGLLNELGSGTTFKELSGSKLKKVSLPLPNIEEQKRIVKKLDEALEKINKAKANTKKNLKNSQELFESELLTLFSKTDGEEVELSDFLILHYGKALDRNKRDPGGKFNVYGANGVKDKANKFLWEEPSIIVGRKGSAGEVNLTEGPFWPLDVTYYVEHNTSRTDLIFLFWLLKTLHLPLLAKGVKPGINRNEVYCITAKLPTLQGQQEIVQKLDRLSVQTQKLTELYQQKLNNLEELRQSLLKQAFGGEDIRADST